MEFAPSEGAGTQVHGLTLLLVCMSVSMTMSLLSLGKLHYLDISVRPLALSWPIMPQGHLTKLKQFVFI